MLSAEGVVVVCQQRRHPLHLAFRAREGVLRSQFERGRCANRRNTSSVSHFERERGWRWMMGRNTPSVLRFKWGRRWRWMMVVGEGSLLSHFERGRGDSILNKKKLGSDSVLRSGLFVFSVHFWTVTALAIKKKLCPKSGQLKEVIFRSFSVIKAVMVQKWMDLKTLGSGPSSM